MKKLRILGLVLLGALLLVENSAVAQQVTATITGQVTDPSGAPIVGASVTARDIDRGTTFTDKSNSEGSYNFPRVQPGKYEIRVTSKGFQTAVRSGLDLAMNQTVKADFAMTLGQVSETVEVTAAAPLLQTQSTEVGQIIDSKTNENLPLATRNYIQLTLLAPGSIHPDPSSFKNGQTTGGSGRPNVNGNREQANNFMLDGLDNNQVSDNLAGYTPGVEAIQEFNEITLTAPADFGNYMGAVISTTIKSGTNAYHGSAFEFFRNDKLNANEWSNNFNGAARAAMRWNSFGGTFGGPIKKDKLFFFADYQGSRLDTPTSISTTSVLTQAERNGDLSALSTAIYNPYSVGTDGKRAPFSGNVIPASSINTVSSKIINSSAYSLPNAGTGLLNNYQYGHHSAINGNQGDIKVDWNKSEKDHIFGRYSQSGLSNPSTNTYQLAYDGFNESPTHTGVLDWTRTLSSSLVNEARVGVNYVNIHNGSALNSLTNFPSTVGFADAPTAFLPSMNISGGNASSFGTANNEQLFSNAVIQYEDTMIWSKGSHSMHFGFQGYHYRMNTYYAGNNGAAGYMNFNGWYTTQVAGNSPSGANGGVGEADFLLGLASDIGKGITTGTWGQRSNSFGSFFQDNWRLSSSLTLNLGLRWELHTPWVEVNNRVANFDLVTGQELIANQDGANRSLYDQYNGLTNFQPRIGFAWNPNSGKLVVRGGYTLSNYLEGTGTNLRLTMNPPFSEEHEFNYSGSNYSQALPPSTLSDGFTPFASGGGTSGLTGATLRVWDPKVRPAVANQWNLTVQEQVTPTLTVTAAYVGQRSTHLMVPMPYYQKVLNSDGTVSPSRYLAGNPTLMSEIGNISGTASIGNQSYHSFQLVAQKRLSASLQFNASYTFSKCMTDNLGYYGQGGQSGQVNWYAQNIYNQAADWGPCDYDAKSNFVANAVYGLPFGHKQKFGANMNKVADAVVGGWQLSGILSLHSGFPLTIGGSDASGTGSRGARADCIAPVDIYGKQNSASGGYQWFNPNDFAATSAGTFGSCGVGTVRGPGLKTLDLNLAKTFSITEKQNLEFRAEAINFTNTPILNAPDHYVGSTLGLLNSSQGARNIQFALKYSF
jgi:hypothetical protein